MLFTNAAGSVVFADRRFHLLAEQPPRIPSTPQALHHWLRTDPEPISQWMQVVASEGYAASFPLTFSTPAAGQRPLSLDGVAVYDDLKRFIGADLLIADRPPRQPTPLRPLRHPDAVATYFQQELSQGQSERGLTFLQVYVSAQIEILQVLLARMGGPGMRQALEMVLNQTAERQRIPARMAHGYLEFASSHINIGHYRALLRAAFSYAVDAIGRRAVTQELSVIDQQLTPGLLPLITHLDIGRILEE